MKVKRLKYYVKILLINEIIELAVLFCKLKYVYIFSYLFTVMPEAVFKYYFP